MSALLTIDLGGTGTKAVLHDVYGGQLGRGYVGYHLRYGPDGSVELDADTWLAAARTATAAALAASGRAANEILAVSVTSTNALLAIGPHGVPLRPAIMQLDRRATREVEALGQDEVLCAEIIRLTGNHPGPMFWLPVLRWLRRHEPGTLRQTRTFLYPSGYLVQQLTGRATIDLTRAATTLLHDPFADEWAPELVDAAGIRPAQLPVCLPSAMIAGHTTVSGGGQLGLPAGIPVLAGCMDSVAGALGAGALRNGDATVVFGTVARTAVVADRPVPAPQSICCPYAAPGRWLNMSIASAGGAVLNWVSRNLYRNEPFEVLGAEATLAANRGGDGVRFAFTQSRSTEQLGIPVSGGTIQLAAGLHHDRGDVAYAALRMIANGLAARLATQAARGLAVDRVTVTGGGANLASWVRLLATATGRRVRVPAVLDTESAGSGMLAAVGAGIQPDLATAHAAMTAPEWTEVLPDPEETTVFAVRSTNPTASEELTEEER